MAKLKLNPEPTFKAKVGIPVPGGKGVDVEFTFKYRSKSELVAWSEGNKALPEDVADVDFLRSFVVGWELDDVFNDENLARLADTYPGATGALIESYLRDSWGARRGN